MGKQLQPDAPEKQTVRKGKKAAKIDRVQGERPYKVKPLLSFYAYRYLKSKRYAKRRREAISQIPLDKFQIKRAAEALKNFENSQPKTDLFEEEGFVYLEIVMGRLPTDYSIRPVQISLPTPIYSADYNTRSVIFVADPQRSYKDKIQDLKLTTLAKVVGYSKLKKNYKMLKEKRSLIYSYDLFFCDWKIYNLLRKPTGRLFYYRKKIPFPIDCEQVPEWLKDKFGDSYEAYLNDLNNYTYFIMGNGPVYTLKVGRVNMETRDLVKNVIHGIYNVIPYLIEDSERGCQDIRQISIKTSRSASLPIISQLTPEEIEAYRSAQGQ